MYKLSLAYRIDAVSPSHVHFSVFCNLIPQEQDHTQGTRAKAGELVLTTAEMKPFLSQTKPNVVLFADTGLELHDKFVKYCDIDDTKGLW
ncbi:MAG: hypothetical protein WC196_04470 [Bacilli bacterium]|jgi:hypothetical protein